ncbi:hypothetical protein ACFOOM_18350 [Streptomyces echinoruber]|uniref:Uncharacterized protein n=1 Tax=Streptomyces echinoruber TaxID=68898 RepID=A0A918RLG4_9ACTN|nr:hypothetical protein [Streptomyces echinoruber]GHA04180.1 hypothetical protein GCM10010389_49620 [Streptomyces echinoruber]
MFVSPFPAISSADELKNAPSGGFVECVNCVAHQWLDTGDPVEFARRHQSDHPWHTRFRIVDQTNFSVGEEP